jgi:hypothetical protein
MAHTLPLSGSETQTNAEEKGSEVSFDEIIDIEFPKTLSEQPDL